MFAVEHNSQLLKLELEQEGAIDGGGMILLPCAYLLLMALTAAKGFADK